MMKYLSLIFLAFSVSLYAQKGTIRGTVIEDSNGEPLFGVTVQIKGTTNGAITDFDGKFEIKADPGTYDLQASFVSFQTVTISGLMVEAEEVTLIDQIRLKEDVALLEEVVVTAEVIRTTEAALLTVKRKSANLIDGISAASFRKIGDSDAASAAKRITGVSIEGGKYVYVRGLGDRYTKTLLNGMDIPGLDPDRNTLQMDIFPTNVLSNIIVSKTFTADLPADFTGGLVNIETQDVPDIKEMTFNASIGYNPRMHFNSDYLTYEGGKTDWLGFDDGTRELHISDNDVLSVQNASAIGDPNVAKKYEAQLNGFSKQLGTMKQSSFMDFSLGFSLGDQKNTSIGTLGYIGALTYQNATQFYDDALFSNYLVGENADTLLLGEKQVGSYGVSNVLLGGMLGVALKREKAKYRVNFLKLQNGESIAGFFDSDITDSSPKSDLKGIQTNLEYSQKSLTNLLIAGEHFLDKWTINWKISPTTSKINDPNIRFTKYEKLENGGFDIGSGNSGFPQRAWRDLQESNLSSRLDVKKEYDFAGKDANVKFGIGTTLKQRDFIIRQFNLTVKQPSFDGSFDELMKPENLWPSSDESNFYVSLYVGGNVNQFDASTSNHSFYVSNEFYPLDKLRAIVGVRGEAYSQIYSGQNQRGIVLDNEQVIDEFNLFPSGNFTYSLTEKQNLRFAYTRTIARYSFKEASFIELYDPLTGRTFLGGLSPIVDGDGNEIWDGNIRSTLINNYDLRWETFGERGQTISLSVFYKQLSDPIEIVQLSGSANNFQSQNVGDAIVYGTELEFRQSLKFLNPKLTDLFVNGNATVSVSEITMTGQEFASRVRMADKAGRGEVVSSKRDLQGQAPYIINAGLAYSSFPKGLELGLYYNVQGPTLAYTGGVNDIPDVYTVPFHSLNFSTNKTFGEDEKMRLTLRVNNILNDKREWEYHSFGLENRPFEARSLGTRVSLGFKYSF